MKKLLKYLIFIFLLVVIGFVLWGIYSVFNAPRMEILSPTGIMVFRNCSLKDNDCWSKNYKQTKDCPDKLEENCWRTEIFNCNIGSKTGPFYSEDNDNKSITLFERIIGQVEMPEEGEVCQTALYSSSHNNWRGNYLYYGRDGVPLPRIVQ
ncbi:MAG: hypothetical protein WC640_00260 [Candidatus Paceibacterota bacterium]|jgi:hypothetical protein